MAFVSTLWLSMREKEDETGNGVDVDLHGGLFLQSVREPNVSFDDALYFAPMSLAETVRRRVASTATQSSDSSSRNALLLKSSPRMGTLPRKGSFSTRLESLF